MKPVAVTLLCYLKSKVGSLNFTSKKRNSKKATNKCMLLLNVLFIKNVL